MIPFTGYQLDNMLVDLIATPYVYYPIANEFFQDMYVTGMRPVEAVTISKWTYISPTTIILQPAKGNSIRTFIEAELTPNFVFAIQNQIKPYEGLTVRQLSSVTKKLLPVPEVTVNEKSIIDYMFRYNRVQMMAKGGASDTAIQTAFGWSSPLLAGSYRTAPIFSPSIIPTMPYQVYTNVINQASTADPSVSVIVEQFTMTPTLTRTSQGELTLTTLEGQLTGLAVSAWAANSNNQFNNYNVIIPNASTVIVTQFDVTGNPVDDWTDVMLEIRRY